MKPWDSILRVVRILMPGFHTAPEREQGYERTDFATVYYGWCQVIHNTKMSQSCVNVFHAQS
jgi:hypothetical protein